MSKMARVISSAVICDFMVRWHKTAMDSMLARMPTTATEKRPTPSVAKLYLRRVLYHRELQAKKASSGVSSTVGSTGAGGSEGQSISKLSLVSIFLQKEFFNFFLQAAKFSHFCKNKTNRLLTATDKRTHAWETPKRFEKLIMIGKQNWQEKGWFKRKQIISKKTIAPYFLSRYL